MSKKQGGLLADKSILEGGTRGDHSPEPREMNYVKVGGEAGTLNAKMHDNPGCCTVWFCVTRYTAQVKQECGTE